MKLKPKKFTNQVWYAFSWYASIPLLDRWSKLLSLIVQQIKIPGSDYWQFNMVTTAIQTCENLLKQIRASNLNFIIHETPYSTKVCLRKRYIKDASGPSSSSSSTIITQTEFLKVLIKTLVMKFKEIKQKLT